MSTTSPQPNSPVAPDPNQLAIDRTRLAYERTLLAWVRTATGLITFGFSIYKFFEIQHAALGVAHSPRLLGAREFAILSIVMGLAALGLATLEHVSHMRALRAQNVHVPYSLAGIFACLIALFGTLGLLAAIFRQ
jgi:putative membrane protein